MCINVLNMDVNMINSKIEKAFNAQINAEIYSAYLYLSMATYLDSTGYTGMALWMKKQAQEEMQHAMKFYDFIYSRSGKVTLTKIDSPTSSWKTLLQLFEDVYDHECKVSSLINSLVELSQEENDYASLVFLQWFVTEQIEEEASALEIVDKLKMLKDSKPALYMLDKELSRRE